MTTSAHDETKDASQKKGRPTPKRKEAEAKLKVNSLSPNTTREGKKKERELMRARRVEARAAYLRGEDSALPARDRGPVKKFVRNYIDSRRTIGEYFIPIMMIIIFSTLINVAIIRALSFFLVYGFMLLTIGVGFWNARKIKKEAAIRFPNESLKGIAMYGWVRSTQMRRMRAPAPQVKRGDSY